MKVEIWSDVMCPFCYVGKHRLEQAIALMPQRDKIEVEWRSYQLQPDAKYVPGKDLVTSIAELKGVPREQMAAANKHITQMGESMGLKFDFDNAKIANTYDALRLIKLAGKHGKANEAEESLFRAFFTEGKVVSDHRTLAAIGISLGLDKEEIDEMLISDNLADEVDADLAEAREIGIQGVPFFVLDRRFAVSGAQPVEAFTNALGQAYAEWEKDANPA